MDGWDGPVYKLSSNENPYPPLPSVINAITNAASTMHRYPNMAAPELTKALAERLGVSESELAFGTGSVEVAGQLIRAFAGHGDEVIYAWRSFEAYPILVRGAGATPVEVALTADHRHDLPAMLAAITPATKVIFICTPNNPTGTAVGHEELREFLVKVPKDILVVIDEAYVDFGGESAIPLVGRYDNLLVVHTLSKSSSLAGLRVGFAVGQDDTHFYVLGGDKSDFRYHRADRQASSARCTPACNLSTPA